MIGDATGMRRPPPRRPARSDEVAGEISAALLADIGSRVATNRADLARHLAVAPSTVTTKVADLISAGILYEAGAGPATGGRPPRVLGLAPGAGHILAIAIGRRQTRVGVLDLAGTLRHAEDIALPIPTDPADMIDGILARWHPPAGLADLGPLRGAGVAVPGPVDVEAGWVDSAAAMPGWHRVPVAELVADRLGVPATLENDANAMALGEYSRRLSQAASGPPPRSMLLVKAGSAVGCGLILEGHLYRGSTALAGDISHIRVPAAGDNLCACGNRGCLETVVGAARIAEDLRGLGIRADDASDIPRLLDAADVQTTTRVRAAGRLLGATLSTVVNFLNPDLLVLGGVLSTSEGLVAAVRSQLYDNCHPLALRNLRIEQCAAGVDAEPLGVGQLALRRTLAAIA